MNNTISKKDLNDRVNHLIYKRSQDDYQLINKSYFNNVLDLLDILIKRLYLYFIV